MSYYPIERTETKNIISLDECKLIHNCCGCHNSIPDQSFCGLTVCKLLYREKNENWIEKVGL